ncbi:hypothetical protein [Pseudosulfitobacter pseudonitzschiae]|uniref:hypothetical protein n=1 Tax=Pseudosulfitobacter pseudonitzschiae TaxID=1402135 RepID=UPI003B7FC690
MKTLHPFSMIHISNEGDTLYVGWLPSNELLVGIDRDWSAGLCQILGADNAGSLNDALRCRDNAKINESVLKVTRTNRGEPYRDGMEICIGDWTRGSAEIFIEDSRLTDICDVIEKGLPDPSTDVTGP